ncbi:MAG: oligopeptide:H+ symporter [Helicobacter sp.]|nr:oligopeptide:H+ symporter [Helicobacter sp.]
MFFGLVGSDLCISVIIYTFIALGLLSIFILLCGIGIKQLNAVNISKNMIAIISIAALLYFGYLFFFAGLQPDERKNLIVFLVLFITATFFWSTFEQQPTSFNLFAQDYTDRIIFGWEIPTAWLQSINSLFVITLAPIMSAMWIALSKKNMEVSSIAKFNLGIIFAAISFGVMMFASYFVLHNGGMQVSPLWLIASYFFLTIGELALSPIGLSLMTSIAPKMIRGQVMGLWFISISLGSVVAGLVGGEVEADKLESLPNLFGNAVVCLLIIAVILFFLKNPLKKMLKTD